MNKCSPKKSNNRPLVIQVNPSGDFQSAILRAKQILLSGGLVVCPTESFYCLAADTANEQAIRRMFFAKSRSLSMPVLMLIPSAEILENYVKSVSLVGRTLIQEFWPGRLTLLFRPSQEVHPLLSAGTGKIGIRLSSHPVATALAQAIGRPITGSSANISGQPPCKDLEDILKAFEKSVDLILDAGEISGSVGSTVLDVTTEPPQIIREGMVSGDELKRRFFQF